MAQGQGNFGNHEEHVKAGQQSHKNDSGNDEKNNKSESGEKGGSRAGLSWNTILKKRENYRKVFGTFDVLKVSRYDSKKIEELQGNAGIIRNKLKINAAIRNAQSFINVQKEFGSFDRYIWQFVGGKPIDHKLKSLKDYPTKTPEAEAMSKDLLKRGFTFVGPTICYAFMQAVGMVNDHQVDCFRH